MNEESVKQWCEDLQRGEIRAVCVTSTEVIAQTIAPNAERESKPRRLIFPGAFDPLHDGHRAMADIAEDISGSPIEFEISIDNVDKQSLTTAEITKRLQQFPPTQSIWLTRAMRFSEKAELFPGATFVVGADTIARIADTIARIADQKYYDGEEEQRIAVQRIVDLHGRFLIFGRSRDGAFHTLDELNLPDDLRAICSGVPRDRFQFDISSSDLRIANRG